MNFILVSQVVKDETPSVSYYSNSKYDESGNSESSESIHSNKRYISYLDTNGEENARAKESENKRDSDFIFFQSEEKKEDVYEANRLQKMI